MNLTTFQRPELRDANNNIIQQGTYSVKNGVLANAQNSGILDYINNNLQAHQNAIETLQTGALQTKIVTALPNASAADANTIYLLKYTSGGEEYYYQYRLIDGSFVRVGDTKIDITDLTAKVNTNTTNIATNTSSIATLSNGKVSKAGDTMSGNLTISKNTQAECDVNNTQANVGVGIVAGSSGARGLYDTVNNKWIIYSPNGATTTNLPSNPASTDNSTQIATTNYVKSNLSSYVAKSGDTMTGALNINSNSNIPLVIKNPDIEYGVSPSSTKTTYFRMCDKSANPITELISQRTTTGTTITYIRTNGQGSGSGYAEIRLTRTANGETTTSAPTPSTTDNSTQIATTSYVKNQFTYKDFAFSSISYTAGTIGTRGYQSSSSVTLSGYTPVSATIISISDSSSIIPITFIQTSSNLLYLNCYRTTTSAVSSNSVTVRVLYKSN